MVDGLFYMPSLVCNKIPAMPTADKVGISGIRCHSFSDGQPQLPFCLSDKNSIAWPPITKNVLKWYWFNIFTKTYFVNEYMNSIDVNYTMSYVLIFTDRMREKQC